jgi:diadenosine tetraphosphatase ApaH/serine/threonine PP2A family protein phosphatase
MVGFGADPEACLDLIKKRSVCLEGFHEAMIFGKYNMISSRIHRLKSLVWARYRLFGERVSDVSIQIPELEDSFAFKLRRRFNRKIKARWDFFKSLPLSYEEAENGRRFFFSDYLQPVYVGDPGFREDARLIDCFYSIERRLFVGNHGKPFLLYGDFELLEPKGSSHRVLLKSDVKAIVNPGSIGYPLDGDPRACYLEISESEFIWHRVEYDVELTCKKINDNPNLFNFEADRILRGGP